MKQLFAALILTLALAVPAAGQNQVGQGGTGTISVADQWLYFFARSRNSIGVQITGTWSGTLNFEVTIDGTTYVPLLMFSPEGHSATTTTSNGVWSATLSNFQRFRVRASGAWTGTASVTMIAGDEGVSSASSGGGGGGGDATAANQVTQITHLSDIETAVESVQSNTSTLAGTVAGSEVQVDVVTSALPTGAATAANQIDTYTKLSDVLTEVQAVKTDVETVTDTTNNALRVNIVAGAASGTEATHDSSAAAAGPQLMAVGSSVAPTAVSADGDAVRLWADRSGRLQVNVAQFSGTAPSLGAGAVGSGTIRVVLASDSPQFGTAAAAADNTANPTLGGLRTFLHLFDGSTWDRAPGTSTDGLLVNLGANNDVDTELPAASALADNTANPTVPGVGAYMMTWDGANWDRMSMPISACDDPAKVTSVNIALAAGTTTTELVPLASGQTIYACGYSLIVGGAGEVRFAYGTGTACGTGNTDIETLNFAAAGDGIAVSNGGGVQFKTAASNALCLERGASVAVTGRLTYVRQ